MRPTALLLAALLAGCGAGTGVGSGAGPGSQVDATRAPWQLVDLASGRATPLAGEPGPDDARITSTHMLFRLVRPGRSTFGQTAGSFARQDDETLRTGDGPTCYMAVFETTRAQWLLIAGTTPWTATSVAVVDGAGGDDLPATGLGVVQVEAALAAWNTRHPGRLSLPDDDAWEAAARAGAATTFPWGEARDPATTARHAVTADAGATGPAPARGRLANAFGLHDMAGNVWELTSGGWARGGSWADVLALARPANRREVPDDGWATVGVRLTWRP